MRIWILGFMSGYGFRICPHPQPFSSIFWHRTKNMVEKGGAIPIFLPPYKYQPLRSEKAKVKVRHPSLPISKSWWRGIEGEDLDSGIYERLWFSDLSSSPTLLLHFLARNQKHGREGGRDPNFPSAYIYQPIRSWRRNEQGLACPKLLSHGPYRSLNSRTALPKSDPSGPDGLANRASARNSATPSRNSLGRTRLDQEHSSCSLRRASDSPTHIRALRPTGRIRR